MIYADALTVNRRNFQLVSAAVGRELEARRPSRDVALSSASIGPQHATIWLSGLGQFLKLNTGSNGLPGYSGSTGGVVAGVDSVLSPDIRIGTAIGFSNQNISTANAATYRGDTVQLQVYGTVRHDPAFVDVQASGLFSEGTGRRMVTAYDARPTGSVGGGGGGGLIRTGIHAERDGWSVEPSIQINGLALGQGDVTETNGGPVGLHVGSSSIASLQSLVGFRIDRRAKVADGTAILSSVQLGWAYEMLDTSARVPAVFQGVPRSGFVVSNPSFGRSSTVLGAQAAMETGTPFQLFASYLADIDGNATAQSVTAGLRYSW